MKHRPHVRSGIATRSPSHEGRGDDARRSVGDVSSDPRFRATYFERGVPSVQSSGLDASRQAARAVGRRKDRSAQRRRSRRDACGRRALRAEPARAASIRYIPRRQGASTRGWRFRTGPTNGRRVLFLVSIQRAPRGRRCLARRPFGRQSEALAHGREHGGVRFERCRFRHARFRRWRVSCWVRDRRAVGRRDDRVQH